jgi:hydroxymethylpyrimidine pyrophosphatase-like HAD family hydrolase
MFVLAADYDGTLATNGRIDATTLAALRSFVAAGDRLVLVTGRRLDDLRSVCPHLDVFTRVVAENGALLHRPDTNETRALSEPPLPIFVEWLRARGVEPIAEGAVIVATHARHEPVVRETIDALSLPLQAIRNKSSLMVLPVGVTKGSGLRAAVDDLGLEAHDLHAHDVVAVGDAENDHALFAACGLGVAVANATESLAACADLVTRGAAGAGVVELIERMLRGELSDRWPRPPAASTPRGSGAPSARVARP